MISLRDFDQIFTFGFQMTNFQKSKFLNEQMIRVVADKIKVAIDKEIFSLPLPFEKQRDYYIAACAMVLSSMVKIAKDDMKKISYLNKTGGFKEEIRF